MSFLSNINKKLDAIEDKYGIAKAKTTAEYKKLKAKYDEAAKVGSRIVGYGNKALDYLVPDEPKKPAKSQKPDAETVKRGDCTCTCPKQSKKRAFLIKARKIKK